MITLLEKQIIKCERVVIDKMQRGSHPRCHGAKAPILINLQLIILKYIDVWRFSIDKAIVEGS